MGGYREAAGGRLSPLRFSVSRVGDRVQTPYDLVALHLLCRFFPLMKISSSLLNHSLKLDEIDGTI